jgi:hypothetical protein
MAKQTFSIGQVLEAADMNALQQNDYNWTVDTKTDNYTLVAGDAGKRIVMNAATAKTITVDDSVFTAGDTVWIHNIGAGTCTVTAGTATVNTAGSLALAQWEGGSLYFTSASSAIFFRGGVSLFNVDYLVVAGGGPSGGTNDGNREQDGAGGAGGLRSTVDSTGGGGTLETAIKAFKGMSATVTVGAGGAAFSDRGSSSVFHTISTTGGGRGGRLRGNAGLSGGSGGGGGDFGGTGGAGTANQGYGGGTGQTNVPGSGTDGGAGGGAGGAGSGSQTRGAGLAITITGSSVTYAQGAIMSDGAGTANRGNGGGTSSGSSSNGGGSGIVVIKYPDSISLTVGAGLTSSTTTSGGFKITSFTAGTDTITFN